MPERHCLTQKKIKKRLHYLWILISYLYGNCAGHPVKGQNVKTQTQAVTKQKAAAVTKSVKPASLFFFQQTPAGRLLRAYFVALVSVQMGGKLQAGKSFKLWPSANVRGHLDCKRMVREDGAFKLTSAGVTYFTDPLQAPDADHVKAFAKAVTSGEKFAAYNFAMTPLK